MSGRGDPRFHQLLDEIGELHDKKQEDYGTDADPFANVRASEQFGVPGWVGGLVRLNDKVHRLQEFARKGDLANESAEDSMLDIAVYALIALVLYREPQTTATVPVRLDKDVYTGRPRPNGMNVPTNRTRAERITREEKIEGVAF